MSKTTTLSLTTLRIHLHPQRQRRHGVHQATDARPDCLRLRKYTRAGCLGRRGGGILYWRVQLPVSSRYRLRNARGRVLSRSSFSSGTSQYSFRQNRAPISDSGLQGSYNAYSEKRGFRIPYGEVLVFALAYEFILSVLHLVSDVRSGVGRSLMHLC